MLNGVDLGVKAEGVTPQIEPVTKHWIIDGVDTQVIAAGTVITIDEDSYNWVLNGTDSGVRAVGVDAPVPEFTYDDDGINVSVDNGYTFPQLISWDELKQKLGL
jgi:hypothetical protein